MEKRKLVLTIIGVVILAMVIMVYIYFRKYILMVIPEEEKPCHWYWQSSRNYIQRHLCAALSGMGYMSRLWR